MPLTTLDEASFELDGHLFGGRDSPVVIEDVDFGETSGTVGDRDRPRADGIAFGRDFRSGRLLTFDLSILTGFGESAASGYGTSAALTAQGTLESAWLADKVRSTPGAVSTLRYRLAGRQRVIYGRGRKFAAVSRWATLGRIPITATFQAIDHLIYDDVEYTNVVDFVAPSAGGLTWPITFPWSTVTVSYSPGVIGVLGGADSWLVIVIRGPIYNPQVRLVNGWTVGLNINLRKGEFVVIDPRPWSRGVRLNNVTNVAGTLDPFSPRLADLRLPWGVHEIVLGGQDETGTASMTLAWRYAYTSP